MLTYRHSHPIIDRVELSSPQRGLYHARIIGTDGADAISMKELRNYLGSKSISTLMDTDKEGREIIEVRGLKNDKQLSTVLKSYGVNEVKPEGELENKGSGSFMEKISDNALFLSALWYDLGNIAFLVSGYQRGKHNKDGKFTSSDISEMMIGAAFGVGDLAMTFCGKDRGNNELIAVEEGLKEHLKKAGIELPKGNSLSPEGVHKSGAAQEIFRWIEKHIIQIKCVTETAAGGFTIKAAMKEGQTNYFKAAGGGLITLGWLGSFLMEKPSGHKIFDGNDTPESLQEKITQNPRGWLARPSAMLNNFASLVGANQERKKSNLDIAEATKALAGGGAGAAANLAYAQNKRLDYTWNIVSAGAFLIANSLFGLSGAKRPAETKDDQHVMRDMVLLSANMLADQPKELRDKAISEASDVVANLTGITATSNDIEKMIHEKIASLNSSKWADRIQHPPAPSQGASASV